MQNFIDQIHYVKGFMPKDVAASIEEYAKDHTLLFDEFGNGEKEFTVHTYHAIEKHDPELLKVMQEYANKVYEFVKEKYEGPFQDFYETKTHIAKFMPGWGMHEHYDASRPNDIATLVYVNDDYLGGEIYFPSYDISYKPEPGDLLCFPDNPDFVHGVKEIKDGIRYTTPRWFTRIV
jgi:hypothetical protein